MQLLTGPADHMTAWILTATSSSPEVVCWGPGSARHHCTLVGVLVPFQPANAAPPSPYATSFTKNKTITTVVTNRLNLHLKSSSSGSCSSRWWWCRRASSLISPSSSWLSITTPLQPLLVFCRTNIHSQASRWPNRIECFSSRFPHHDFPDALPWLPCQA